MEISQKSNGFIRLRIEKILKEGKMMDVFHKVKVKSLKAIRKQLNRYCRHLLRKENNLWDFITTYKKESPVTGCSWIDLWTLYNYVRKQKPQLILECGPGLSTVVMSYAIMENEKEGISGKIISMEDQKFYYEKALAIHPNKLKPYVNFVLSPKVEMNYYIFRGVMYQDVPKEDYDFVFIDGPDLNAPSNNQMAFDADFIRVLENSKKEVFAIVDYRLTTSFVFQTLLGRKKVYFDSIKELAFIGPVSKDDLAHFDLDSLTNVFLKRCNLIGNSQISLK